MKKFLKTKKTREAIAACPGLTNDGAGAIYLFTCESPLYKELNAKLRARDRAALKVRSKSPQSFPNLPAPNPQIPKGFRGPGSLEDKCARLKAHPSEKTAADARQEGYFPYARLLYEGYRALCTGKPRMLNRGVKKDLVGSAPDDYAEEESLLWWSFSSTTK